MVSILTGLIAGLVATVAMTMFMMAMGDDSPPPTAALWAKYVGDEGPAAYMKQGLLLHLLYGVGAGAVFAVGATALALDVGAGVLVGSALWGLAFGLALMVGGMAFWMRVVLAMEPDPKTMGAFGFFHVVYGVVLGAGIALLPV
jgi:hypothetical protein